MSALEVLPLGLVAFDEAWAKQREYAARVRAEPARVFLLLLRHPPVITLGRNADERNVLDPGGIPVRRIDRGGDVTYHGPGQIVGYPILSLREHRLGVRAYVLRLEEAIVDALSKFGVRGFRKEDAVGVWTSNGKIASIGVRVERGVTMHGFALNVADDLEPFVRIHPCGVPRGAVTSVEREIGSTPDLGPALAPSLARRIGLSVAPAVVS